MIILQSRKKLVLLMLLLTVFDQISSTRRSMLLFLITEKGPRATLWPCLHYTVNLDFYKTKFLLEDCLLESISSTFYIQIFRTNVILAVFSSLVLALSKNSYEKRASLTLVKLTAGPLMLELKFFSYHCCLCYQLLLWPGCSEPE